MRPLSESTARVAGRNFERKYIALGRIVKHWPDIVGAALANKAQPVRIHYRKKDKKQRPETSLDIATSSANATLLHYQKDLILERINQIFGERWITSVRFVSAPACTSAPQAGKKRAAPLTAQEKNTLSSMLTAIEDDTIRLKLESLGTAIIAREKT